MTDDAPGPPLGELRAASASLMADRLRDDLEARLSTTRRGRLALRTFESKAPGGVWF